MIFFPLSRARLLHEIIITIPTHKKELYYLAKLY